ncbi:urea ABC transporter substrate-binding protein [Paramagnetospirillum marisnigri]|uniref:Urea ABC transporter substrate-binding protein n=1 Tax=Paramagnetospirillum marisnigri TaxID=1285242 RepID=A0A178MC47_9PROT|nr:urea ABC transporter substrate-binding protein [Paramagnetospirillum marisnigri]
MAAVLLALISWAAIYAAITAWPSQAKNRPIKVGVLHSLSGTMAVSERTVADATLFAIEELNRRGGVLGRKVEPVVVDGKSDWAVFAAAADRLIATDKVSAVFGCWTSACRKTVKPVFERRDAVLFYPVQYEGLEQSPNIVYTGAAPNQQIIPAIKWSLDHLGRKLFLVGSDYVFPRTANKIIAAQAAALQGLVVGESYAPLGDQDFAAIVAEIKRARPDVIFNTINGDSNLGFFKALRAAGITPDRIPVMSFSIAEAEVKAMGPAMLAGDYAARNYFQSVDTEENAAFVSGFKARYGTGYVTTAPMEAAYFGVMLWAKAVEEAGSPDFRDYRAAIRGQSMAAPGGTVTIDPVSQHTWKTVRIGRIQADGNFEILWDSQRPVRPVPYPSFLPRSDWVRFLDQLYGGWDGNWAAPARRSPS